MSDSYHNNLSDAVSFNFDCVAQQKTRRLTKVRARVNLPMVGFNVFHITTELCSMMTRILFCMQELDLAKFSSFKNEYPEERSSSDQSEDDTAEQCATKRKCTETVSFHIYACSSRILGIRG